MGRIRIAIVAAVAIALAGGSERSSSALEPALESAIDRALTRLVASDLDPLVPRPVAIAAEVEPEQRRNFAIARSIRTVEAGLDTTLAVVNGDVLPLLSLARNYRHLGLRERALVWYERAGIADREGDYTATLATEVARCTAELSDSTRSVELLEAMLQDGRAARSAQATRLLLHSIADLPQGKEILRLVQSVEALGSRDPRLLCELGSFRLREGAAERARDHYARVLRGQDAADLAEVAIALRGFADATLLAGRAREASALYTRFRSRDAGRLSAWSTYQLGSIAAAEGDLEVAVENFQSICERAEETPWRDEACTRLAQARQLAEIDGALRPYGRSLRE